MLLCLEEKECCITSGDKAGGGAAGFGRTHTYAAVAEQLGIRKAERIKAWVRMYRREGELSFHKPIGRPREEQRVSKGNGTVADGERPAKKIPYRIAGSAARAAQYRAIYHHKEEYEVKAMCEFFGVSRAAYYAWVKQDGRTRSGSGADGIGAGSL